jgi:2-keto-4-pentenoate hydratase/2-oxohepta-3-ene-1,7-dioic acid hydratase in catechol pathway
MKYVRFLWGKEIRSGIVEGETVHEIGVDLFSGLERTGKSYPLKTLRLLAPTAPSKIVAIGLNYKDHVAEFGRTEIPAEPVIFLKAPSAVIGPAEAIVLPKSAGRVDYEAELGLVIGKRAHHVAEAEALDYVLGVTCLNDVTARELQKKDVQWARAKSFDTFCPIGPWIVSGLDLSNVRVESKVNGQPKQRGNTKDMIFPVAKLVAYVSRIMTLLPGDVIATGTPVGVGQIQDGDEVEIFIEGVGSLKNPVVAEK